MKRKVTVVLGPWGESLDAHKCSYEQIELDIPDEIQRVLAVSVENVGPSLDMKKPDVYQSPSTIIENHHLDNLVGKLLTYVDATYADKEQRSAHKDLVRQTVWEWYAYHQRNATKTIDFAQEQVKQ